MMLELDVCVYKRTRLMEGLSRSSRVGRTSPRGEWNSFLCSSRSLPSWELLQLLRLSTGERPESWRDEGFWGGADNCKREEEAILTSTGACASGEVSTHEAT
ncbi:hypothetical protein EYF80_036780 [Liparis tanakae]|uniref:Uncharacterized protein n=1 Tax=Liparis tanakae TaxID=230148 RepID=A0A4Z2GI25_9TELE|nr:hypothetical protein EYF80_036780 [Liparis tanakae]